MGTGLGTILLGSRAADFAGTAHLKRVLHEQVWRRLPVIARRKVFHTVSSLVAPGLTADAKPAGPYIVVGMLRHTCGLGVGARLCYEALRDSGLDVYGIDITAGIGQRLTLPGYGYRDGSGLIGKGTLIVHINAHMMAAVLREVGRDIVADKHVIGYWAWELKQVPPDWKRGVDLCHQVWATSSFTADAIRPILKEGQPIHVVHHPVAMRDAGPVSRRGDPRFTVLSIFEMASCPERKNPFAVVRAFKDAFRDDPNVLLRLKVGSPTVSPNQFAALKAEIGNAANIECITRYLTDDELAALYAEADVYLTLPRSEGFGLTLVEAMLAGLPVVASSWSGQADFLTARNSLTVGHTLIPAQDENRVYDLEGAVWADPSVDDAAETLVMLRDDPDLRRAIGEEARADALRRFSRQSYLNAVGESLMLTETLKAIKKIAPAIPAFPIAARSTAVYLGDNIALTSTRHGLKLFVDTRDLSLAPHILIDGNWEGWITDAMLSLLRPGMNVIEIGANIGWFTTLIGRELGASGSLTAYEANPHLAELAFRNIYVNGLHERATVVAKAVTDKPGTITFNVFERYLGSSSLYAVEATAKAFHDELKSITVPTVSLDSIHAGQRIDLIKIDAEGAEPLIIAGALQLLAANRDIQIVMEHAPTMLNAIRPLDQFHAELRTLGLVPKVIAHNGGIKPTTWDELKSIPHCDIVLSRTS